MVLYLQANSPGGNLPAFQNRRINVEDYALTFSMVDRFRRNNDTNQRLAFQRIKFIF